VRDIERDTKSAIHWMVDVALMVTHSAFAYQDRADELISKVRTITACAELPGDMPLRVRCTPNVFAPIVN
jgi:hypothetical protein